MLKVHLHKTCLKRVIIPSIWIIALLAIIPLSFQNFEVFFIPKSSSTGFVRIFKRLIFYLAIWLSFARSVLFMSLFLINFWSPLSTFPETLLFLVLESLNFLLVFHKPLLSKLPFHQLSPSLVTFIYFPLCSIFCFCNKQSLLTSYEEWNRCSRRLVYYPLSSYS